MELDLALVGGGLANSLIAYRLAAAKPEIRVALVERESSLGGEHTWSFHESDLTPEQHAWLAPFVEHRWPRYEVRFPQFRREIGNAYLSFTSSRLHEVIMDVLKDRVMLDADVESVSPRDVILRDGRRIHATAVIDGRGDPRSPHLVLRYQKFLGQVLVLKEPHGMEGPILMDATVAQQEGYRFLYTLPRSKRVVLVEDTRYSDAPALSREALRNEIRRYAEKRGWQVTRVEREEEGILPIVLSGDIQAFWEDSEPGVPRSGLRAALFHATTGYSLPDAVRLADDLAARLPCSASDLYGHIRRRSIETWNNQGFFRMLNRMLFLAGAPEERFRVLERFYRLPAPLIQRFYAARLTRRDQMRLLLGAPPVPIGGAIRALFASGADRTSAGAAASPGGHS